MIVRQNKKNGFSALQKRKACWGYAFILPWLILFCIFSAYPLAYGFICSFTDADLSGMNYIGVDNFKKLFNDYAFWRSVVATLRYAVILVPLTMFIPLWIANCASELPNALSTMVKALVYIPGVTCSVAMVIVWNFIFLPRSGLLNQFLGLFGVPSFAVFDNPDISVPVIALLIVFTGLGTNTVLYSGALGAIPKTYYEAAELDGASRFRQFVHVTIPMLRPTMIYTLITGTIGALQIIAVPMLLTKGGPNFASSPILLLVYNSAFGNGNFGYASALGMVLFLLIAFISVIQFRVTRRESVEY